MTGASDPLDVLARRVLIDRKGCWIPDGHRNNGYAIFTFNGASSMAHRASWELLVGPIPEGLQLDHLCRVRACVNPDHLEPVTQRENTLRGVSPVAENARKTHCPQGHPFAGSNLRVEKAKYGSARRCLTCFRARRAVYQREYRARKKAAS